MRAGALVGLDAEVADEREAGAEIKRSCRRHRKHRAVRVGLHVQGVERDEREGDRASRQRDYTGSAQPHRSSGGAGRLTIAARRRRAEGDSHEIHAEQHPEWLELSGYEKEST